MKYDNSKNEQYEVYRFIPLDFTGYISDFDMVCVYNNYECFTKELLSSLKKQKCNYCFRLIAFNNKNSDFTSMARAYNEMMNCVESKRVIFLHQDIRFMNEKSLNDMLNEALAIPENSVWGIGGVLNLDRKIPCPEKGKPILVETVDECLFGMTTDLCNELLFNEELCTGWHMYSAEMCIHNNICGGTVYMISADGVCHLSMGKISTDYVDTLYRIIEFYKPQGIKTIWTTCAKVDLTKPYRLYIFIWLIKHIVLNSVIRPIRGLRHKKDI